LNWCCSIYKGERCVKKGKYLYPCFRDHWTGTVLIQMSTKRLAQFFSPIFTYLRNKIGCQKLTKQVLVCICAVLVQGALSAVLESCFVLIFFLSLSVMSLSRGCWNNHNPQRKIELFFIPLCCVINFSNKHRKQSDVEHSNKAGRVFTLNNLPFTTSL
jgi:hypothetical protein